MNKNNNEWSPSMDRKLHDLFEDDHPVSFMANALGKTAEEIVQRGKYHEYDIHYDKESTETYFQSSMSDKKRIASQIFKQINDIKWSLSEIEILIQLHK